MKTSNVKCYCGAVLAVPVSRYVDRGRCKKCGKRFRWKPKRSPRQRVFNVDSSRSSQRQTNVAHTNTEAPIQSCPSCQADIVRGSVVCISCGYHSKLKRRLKTFDSRSATVARLAKSGALGLAALLPVLTWPLMPLVDAPDFLEMYYALFGLAGFVVLGIRKLWIDRDLVNYTVLILVAGIGFVRLVNSLLRKQPDAGFMFAAIIVSFLIFWWGRPTIRIVKPPFFEMLKVDYRQCDF